MNQKSRPISPWGSAPTALIPQVLRETIGHIPAPQEIRRILGENTKLRDLDGNVWSKLNRVSKRTLRDIAVLIHPKLRQFRGLPITKNSSSLNLELDLTFLPLTVRTFNAISRASDDLDFSRLTFGDLIKIPNLGTRSIVEFVCILEEVLHLGGNLEGDDPIAEASESKETFPRELQNFIRYLSAYAKGEKDSDILSEVLPPPLESWPPEIKEFWDSIGKIPTDMHSGELIERYSVPILLSQWIESLPSRHIDILARRVLRTGKQETLEELGFDMGITRERVRQIENKAKINLNLLAGNLNNPIMRRAIELKNRLGVAVPLDSSLVNQSLDWATSDCDFFYSNYDFGKALFLWLAGPYYERKRWLVSVSGLRTKVRALLLDARDERGLLSQDVVNSILRQQQIKEPYHTQWMKDEKYFCKQPDGYIYLKGSFLTKAESILKHAGRPLLVEEIIEFIGPASERSVRQRMIKDDRFWRINVKNQFVLAGTEGYDEYTGIIDEILQEIEACGGKAEFSHLVEKICRVYGVKKTSMYSYLNTPMFIKDDNGFITVRTKGEAIEVKTDINKTPGCYRNLAGKWIFRMQVDQDALRGSGRQIPNAFANELGLELGDQARLDSRFGPVLLTWHLVSTNGASIGSLREALNYFGAKQGDYLFISKGSSGLEFDFLANKDLEDSLDPLTKVAMLCGGTVGLSKKEAIEYLKKIFDLDEQSQEEFQISIREKLNGQGETAIASLIKKPALSVESYLEKIGSRFG